MGTQSIYLCDLCGRGETTSRPLVSQALAREPRFLFACRECLTAMLQNLTTFEVSRASRVEAPTAVAATGTVETPPPAPAGEAAATPDPAPDPAEQHATGVYRPLTADQLNPAGWSPYQEAKP